MAIAKYNFISIYTGLYLTNQGLRAGCIRGQVWMPFASQSGSPADTTQEERCVRRKCRGWQQRLGIALH